MLSKIASAIFLSLARGRIKKENVFSFKLQLLANIKLLNLPALSVVVLLSSQPQLLPDFVERNRQCRWKVGSVHFAELQVFSRYRGWKACQATRAISTTSRRELSSRFFIFFPTKARRRRKFTLFTHTIRGNMHHRMTPLKPGWLRTYQHQLVAQRQLLCCCNATSSLLCSRPVNVIRSILGTDNFYVSASVFKGRSFLIKIRFMVGEVQKLIFMYYFFFYLARAI